MRAVLFHNPTAGPEELDKKGLLAAFKLAGIEADYVSTKDDDVKAALKKSADLFAIAGGDGTVRKILSSMPDRSIPAGILPLGTANNVARSLGIAGTIHELVEGWDITKTQTVDIGFVKGLKDEEYFVEAFGIGVIPHLLKIAEKKIRAEGADNLRKGRETFRKVLKDAPTLDLDIMIDGEPVDGELLGVEILNTPYSSAGLPLAPKADPGDGLLDVVFFEAELRDALIDWLETPHKEPPPVRAKQGSKIALTWQDAPHRFDDKFYEAKDKEQAAEVSVAHERALVLIHAPKVQPKTKQPEEARA
ncbi:MAG: hypothetical protein JO205_11560 [Pseudolabrys sp.]|nr:hypothetical protein [Pseudolabrys sp.]MBV9261998.1 hypothetical protein [Pseudolabrys sp.]